MINQPCHWTIFQRKFTKKKEKKKRKKEKKSSPISLVTFQLFSNTDSQNMRQDITIVNERQRENSEKKGEKEKINK